MKKTLLTLATCALSLTAMAQTITEFSCEPSKMNAPRAQKQMKAPLKEEGASLWYNYCDQDIYSGIGYNVSGDYYVSGAIKIPAETAKLYQGAEISAVRAGLCQVGYTEIYAFVTKDLTATPELKEQATLSLTGDYTWYRVPFSAPYVIEGDSDLYVGYIYKSKGGEYALGVDGIYDDSGLGDFIGAAYSSETTDMEFQNIGTMYGDVSVMVELSGNLPSVVPIFQGLAFDDVVRANQEFEIGVLVKNMGGEEFTTANVTYTLGDEINNLDVAVDIPQGQTDYIVIGGLKLEASGAYPLQVKVNSINNVETEAEYSGYVNCSSAKQNRMMVVEEGTSNGCGFCPRGIVGMDYMSKTYPEGFIGIAAHMTGQGNDPMIIKKYNDGISSYLSGMPSCLINRMTVEDPNAQTLEAYYKYYFENMPTLVDVELDAAWADEDKTTLTLTSTSTFGTDVENASAYYRVAFVLTENQVGPYNQSNYYSGGSYGVLDGWEKKQSYVSWLFDDVARYISNFNGTASSFPKQTLTEGTPYTSTVDVDLTSLKNYYNANIVVNNDNLTAIVMVVNQANGQILNAAKVSAANFNVGVEDILSAEEGVTTYYDLQGMKVAAPENGKIYIAVKNGKASKIILK